MTLNIRSQIGMVFHLDKCIGCHTCSIACKNIWTDRKGAEYMWWNNVETKPGTGYPHKWEDQEIYNGGWVRSDGEVALKSAGKVKGMKNLFHNPHLPVLDDYYEPWTYKYSNLFDAPEGDDQPVAHTVSLVTGKPIDVKAGPNWDDDLSGSPDYARNDPNLRELTAAEKKVMFQLEKMTMFYLPRVCNHCLNPACVAACPSGAAYKRGEDGIVLINQNKCRAWRMCVSSCPYKKSYYNWKSGKSEKCILCYPRLEAGHAPACMHSCVGRIRYLGVLLYDADKIKHAASCSDRELVDRQLDIYADPSDPEVVAAAQRNGVPDLVIEAAQKSPIYRFVKEWKIALPLHPEFRTLPNLFYVPPLLPVLGSVKDSVYDSTTETLFGDTDDLRLPFKYLARLFAAGDTVRIRTVLNRLLAVRMHRRSVTVGDIDKESVSAGLEKTNLTPEVADAIFRLTALAKFEERFVIPPSHREEAIEMLQNTGDAKGDAGFGFRSKP